MIRHMAVGLGVLTFSILTFAQGAINPVAPDPDLTPGTLCDSRDPDFTEFRYKERIAYCVRNVSSRRKSQIYDLYQVVKSERSQYTVDHLIPLALGGNNADTNLWPEHVAIKRLRQTLEFELYQKIEKGVITQKEAIQIIIDAKLNPPIDELIMRGLY
jgi:hypothetical protein